MMNAEQVLKDMRRQYRRILMDKLSSRRVRLAAGELATAVRALDESISRGGHLPASWQPPSDTPPWE
jgi:hypothetical protein